MVEVKLSDQSYINFPGKVSVTDRHM